MTPTATPKALPNHAPTTTAHIVQPHTEHILPTRGPERLQTPGATTTSPTLAVALPKVTSSATGRNGIARSDRDLGFSMVGAWIQAHDARQIGDRLDAAQGPGSFQRKLPN